MTGEDCSVAVPERELVLVDFEMPVGNTGIVFVAALEAQMASWGPVFQTIATQAAYRRAASTLAQMALVHGATFEFMRHGAEYSIAGIAQFLGVSEATIEAWEAGTEVVPTNQWYLLADKICAMDGREFCPFLTLPALDLRARRIRVYPDVPRVSSAPTQSPCEC